MEREHPDREALERLMRDELTAEERGPVIRHLLTGCSRCVAVTRRFWSFAAEPLRTLLGEPRGVLQNPGGTLHPASYRGVFERVLATVAEREVALAGEREEAPRLCDRLLRLPASRRPAALHRDRRFASAALAELLLAKSRKAAREESAAAVELAELALAVAEQLRRRRRRNGGEAGLGGSLAARAAAHLGNSRRIAGDLTGAKSALELARGLYRQSPVEDPNDLAELLCFEASLHCAQGHGRQSRRLLDRALALYQTAGERHLMGATLLQKACSEPEQSAAPTGPVEAGDTATLALLRHSLSLLDEHVDPALVACALHFYAELANAAGHLNEAAAAVRRARGLYARQGNALGLLRLKRLEGRIERALGRSASAEAALREAGAGLLAAGLGREAVQAWAELAVLQGLEERWEDVRRTTGETHPLWRARGLRREAACALLIICRAVEEEGRSLDLLGAIADYLAGSPRLACPSWLG